MKISYALAALVAMLCMAGIVSADQVIVSGTLGGSFTWGGISMANPSPFATLHVTTSTVTNTEAGTTSATSNTIWHVDVTSSHNPMTSSTGALGNKMQITSTNDAINTGAQDLDATMHFPFPGIVNGASGTKNFALSQLVTMADAPDTYGTTLTFTGAAL
jgi:hypothetical protein